jgi:hypothetical protein
MASSENVQCKVSRVKLTGGYTRFGVYFGVGAPLFHSEQWDDTGWYREEFFRAGDYQSARELCKSKGWKVSR